MSKLDAFKSRKTPDNVAEFPKSERRGKVEGFAQIPLKAAAEFSQRMKNSDYIIFTMLIYRAFRTGSQTFEMSNDLPMVHGVGRMAKLRSLARFERAGVIQIEHRGRKAPIVTLLVKLN
jgi:hypothetical protein